MLFLSPENGYFEVVPFASNVFVELHSTEECSSEQCFWVEVFYNGKLMAFQGDCLDADHCTYPEFMQMLQTKGFVNTDTHYEKECAKQWSPPSLELVQ